MNAKNILLVGPCGSGKTYNAKKTAQALAWQGLSENEKQEVFWLNPLNFTNDLFEEFRNTYIPRIVITSLHEGYSYSDLIEGIKMYSSDGELCFRSESKTILKLLEELEQQNLKEKSEGKEVSDAFLILDDIHRVDIMSALGEVLYAMNHRGEKVTLSSGKSIVIPENLYIIATMNSIQAQFNVDYHVLSSFDQIIKMESNENILKEALDNNIRKSIYIKLLSLIKDLYREKKELDDYIEKNNAKAKVKDADKKIPSFIKNDMPDYSVFNFGDSEKIENLYPINANGISTGIQSVNKSCKRIIELANEIHEEYIYEYQKAKYAFEKDKLIIKQYLHYNGILNNISKDFQEDKLDYVIGYSYFLPGENGNLNEIANAVQHKIHHQVFPLLIQYAKEGIIKKEDIPSIDRTHTVLLREKYEVIEEVISYYEDLENVEIAKRMYEKGEVIPNHEHYKEQSRRKDKVNISYVAVYEIVKDILKYSLINTSELMDIFLSQKGIICTRNDAVTSGGSAGGGLFVEDSYSNKILSKDTASGNQGIKLYKKDYHKIIYMNKEYIMVSKFVKTENKDFCSKELNKSYANNATQSSRPDKAIKMLTYFYLEKYSENLIYYIESLADGVIDKINAEAELAQLQKDINIVANLTDKNGDLGKPYHFSHENWEKSMVNTIRNLPTWSQMINGALKGVYKKMETNYQDIMEKTDIRQMILQGPPGTSKTYGVKEFLCHEAGIDKDKKDELEKRQLKTTVNGEYELPDNPLPGDPNKKIYWDIVQFHPSYCYEDFVRGIAVKTLEENLKELNGIIEEDGIKKLDVKLKMPSGIVYETVNRTLGKFAKIALNFILL